MTENGAFKLSTLCSGPLVGLVTADGTNEHIKCSIKIMSLESRFIVTI